MIGVPFATGRTMVWPLALLTTKVVSSALYLGIEAWGYRIEIRPWRRGMEVIAYWRKETQGFIEDTGKATLRWNGMCRGGDGTYARQCVRREMLS